jgi:hypothetical protein
VPLPDDGPAPLPDASRTVEVRRHGQVLGAIAVTVPPGRALAPTEDRGDRIQPTSRRIAAWLSEGAARPRGSLTPSG